MTFDDPRASMDCARKKAHTEKAVNGSERVNSRFSNPLEPNQCKKSLDDLVTFLAQQQYLT